MLNRQIVTSPDWNQIRTSGVDMPRAERLFAPIRNDDKSWGGEQCRLNCGDTLRCHSCKEAKRINLMWSKDLCSACHERKEKSCGMSGLTGKADSGCYNSTTAPGTSSNASESARLKTSPSSHPASEPTAERWEHECKCHGMQSWRHDKIYIYESAKGFRCWNGDAYLYPNGQWKPSYGDEIGAYYFTTMQEIDETLFLNNLF